MKKTCSIITIAKIKPDDGTNSVEFSKMLNGILENPKTVLFLDTLQENNPDVLDTVYEIFNSFATKVVDICKKVDEISLEIDYDQPMNELSMDLNLLLANSEQMMDQTYFDICIEAYDEFEEVCITKELTALSFDFNVVLKNEYVKVISIKKNGLN